MRRETLAALISLLCALTLADIPGEAVKLASDVPMAEPHTLEGAMNIVGTGSDINPEDCFDRDAMNSNPLKPLVETKESVQNGQRNMNYLEDRRQANALLPLDLQHKSLTDIWKKETPCECPFNIWKPVCGVDGNTYPTECFAKCIDMDIFVYADCKYVQKELWKKMRDQLADGIVPTIATYDDNELCVEGEDDDPEDPRPKCPRKLVPSPEALAPFPEDEEPENAQPAQPSLRSAQVNFQEDAETIPEPKSAETEESGKIEYRMFNGMRVPYYTGEVENPCEECGVQYLPVCGEDNKTYPSRCFAECMDAVVAHDGECDVVQ